VEIDRDRGVEVLDRQGVERARMRYSRVVDQDIDGSEVAHDRLGQPGALPGARDVGLREDGPSPLGLDQSDRLGRGVGPRGS
jgi:hypothetical protein